jgi:hypothetical protein
LPPYISHNTILFKSSLKNSKKTISMKKSFYLSLLVVCFSLCAVGVRAQAPVIDADPVSDTVCAGSVAMFHIIDTPVATPPHTYRWQVSTTGGATWDSVHASTVYAGISNDTLLITTNIGLRGNLYRAIAFNASGSDTSLAATLTVDSLPVAGVIMGAMPVCVGSSITLTNSAADGVWSHTSSTPATFNPATQELTGVAQGFDTVKYTVTNTCGFAVATAVVRVDTVVVGLPISGPSLTCVGHFITLTNPNIYGTHVWSSSAPTVATVSTSGTVVGVSGGTTTITYSFTNACNPSTPVVNTYNVTVDTPLAPAVITGASAVCAGTSTTLSSSLTGGVWFSDSSFRAVVTPSGIVTGISQGTANISYIVSNGCGAVIATHTMAVYGAAAAIVGLDSVGIGLTRTLTDSTWGGFWTSSDTFVAKIDSFTGVVSGRDTGVTMISYSVTNVCGTSIATMLMHVGPQPYAGAVYGPDSVCIGNTITLADTLVPGGVWSMKDTFATINPLTGILTGVHFGKDTVIYTVTNGFGSTIIKKSVFVNQPPTAVVSGPTSISLGGNYFIKGTPFGGYWYSSNSTVGIIVATIDSANVHKVSFASFVMLTPGTDTVFYVVHNTCGIDTSYWVAHIPVGTGINTASNGSGLKVFPNPSKGTFTLNLQTGTTENAAVSITNLIGEEVMATSVSTNNPAEISLNQPAGLYFITASTPSGKWTVKVVIGN